MLYCLCMAVFTPQELLYLIGSICLLFVAGFLCWVLYEIARLVRQANTMVSHTRTQIEKIETVAVGAIEKLSNASSYLGFLAEGGKQIFSMVSNRRKAKPLKKGKRKLSEIMEEEDES